jgi:hypothetical protein
MRKVRFFIRLGLLLNNFPATLTITIFSTSLLINSIIYISSDHQANQYLLFLTPLAFVLVFIIKGMRYYFRVLHLFQKGITTEGTLMTKVKTRIANQRPGGIEYYYKYQFCFEDNLGNTVTFLQRSTKGKDLKIKKNTTIIYDPKIPSRAMAIELITGNNYKILHNTIEGNKLGILTYMLAIFLSISILTSMAILW